MFKNIFRKKQAIHAQSVVDLRDYTPEALSNIKVIEAVALLILPENPTSEFIEAYSKIHLDAVAMTLNLSNDKKIAMYNNIQELYEKYYSAVYKYFRKKIGENDAEDLTQQTLLNC